MQVVSERLGHFLSLASELQLEGLTERRERGVGPATEKTATPPHDLHGPETREYSIEECEISHDPVEITAKVFQCDICGSKLSSGRTLRRHRRSVHQVSEVVKKDVLYRILEQQNQTGVVFTCDQCDHTTSSQKYLKQHLLVHEETKVHQCNFCEHSTKRAHDLKRHMEKKHPMRRLSAVTE